MPKPPPINTDLSSDTEGRGEGRESPGAGSSHLSTPDTQRRSSSVKRKRGEEEGEEGRCGGRGVEREGVQEPGVEGGGSGTGTPRACGGTLPPVECKRGEEGVVAQGGAEGGGREHASSLGFKEGRALALFEADLLLSFCYDRPRLTYSAAEERHSRDEEEEEEEHPQKTKNTKGEFVLRRRGDATTLSNNQQQHQGLAVGASAVVRIHPGLTAQPSCPAWT